MNLYTKIISLFSIGIILSFKIFAQETQQDIFAMDSVLVFSERIQIPFSQQGRNISIITQEDIQKLPVKSINELLTFVSGVDVRQKGPNGTQADIGIDGGTFDQTLVLINGVKISDPQTGHNMMMLPVPLSAIERVEVLKGAAARIYGVNAMMGVINIVTKSADQHSVESHVYTGSSFQKDDSSGKTYINYGLEASVHWKRKRSTHLLSTGLDKGNGYRYNTDYSNTKTFYHSSIQISNRTQLEIQGGLANYQFGTNAFYAAPGDKESKEDVKNAHLSVRLPIQINDQWNTKIYANYRYGFDDYIHVKSDPSIYRNIHHTHTWDAGWDNTLNLDWGTISAGVQIRNEHINSTNLGKRNRNNLGLFAAYQNNWDKLNFNAGLFLNHNTVFGTQIYPGFDLGYHVDENWKIYANAGMGQRLPTFTDLYYSGPNNLGNEFLKPEYMTTYEAGVNFQNAQSRWHTSVFYRDGKDFIDWVRSDTTVAWQVNNFTHIQTLGLHSQYLRKIMLAGQNLSLMTSYTYLYPTIGQISDASMQNYQSQYAINNLKHQWIVRAYIPINQHWEIIVGNRWMQRYGAENTAQEAKRGQYNLLDTRLQYQAQTFTLYMDVNNLSNVQYIESGVVPLPGRWFTLGLNIFY